MNPLKRSIILLLAILLLFPLVNMAKAQPSLPPLTGFDAEEWNKLMQMPYPPSQLTEQDKILQDNALRFLTNVAKLNTSSYHVEVFIDDTPGPNYDKTLKFNLTSGETKLDVLFLFRDNSLFWCTIYPVTGSPAFTTPKSSDVLSTAKDTLDRLQAFSAKEYLPTVRSMLDTVTELRNSKTTIADFTQEIAVSGNTVRISWEPFANGLSNPQNKLTLEFENGHLSFFADYLSMFKIGSSDVKISEQEAIKIALEYARNYSWVQDNQTVSNVNVLDSPVIANISLQNKGNNTLYPYWNIWLPLDKMYPGGVTAFHVGIWADTGEVAFITPIGYGGDPNAVPSESQETTSDYSLAIAITLITATAVIVSYLFYKRKR